MPRYLDYVFLAQQKTPTMQTSLWPPKSSVIAAVRLLSLVGFQTWPHGIFKLAEEYLLDRALSLSLIEYSRLIKVPVFLKNRNPNAPWTQSKFSILD